ncbi:MAG: hypothetical protein ACKPKO_18550, partial [Candidatus Fonsibacter sp.]
RRIPLYWNDVADPEEQVGAVLTYDCQHFSMRVTATTYLPRSGMGPELIVNAHESYEGILTD